MPLLHSELKQAVLDRQREYKMAAIHAKQGGDIDLAKQHYLTAKVTESMLMLSHKSIYLFVCKKSQNSILKELTLLHSEAGHAGGGDRRRRTSRPELTASSPWSV